MRKGHQGGKLWSHKATIEVGYDQEDMCIFLKGANGSSCQSKLSTSMTKEVTLWRIKAHRK